MRIKLNKEIDPLYGEPVAQNRSKTYITNLVQRIRHLNPPRQRLLIGASYELGIMVLQPFYLRWLMTIVAKIKKHLVGNLLALVLFKVPATHTELLDGLTDHIIFGKDEYDPESAGGLDKNELQAVANMVNYLEQHDGTINIVSLISKSGVGTPSDLILKRYAI